MNNNSQIPTKEEIIKNMAKHLQTHPEDGEEVLLRTYELAFIKGTIDSIFALVPTSSIGNKSVR